MRSFLALLFIAALASAAQAAGPKAGPPDTAAISRLIGHVQACWLMPQTSIAQVVEIEATVDSHGMPRDQRIVSDGGDAALAQSALVATQRDSCQPWPAPRAGGWEEGEKIRLRFTR